MPRLARGPYLKVREQKRNGEEVAKAIYYIYDRDRRISTGFLSPKEKKQAEEALETYIRAKFIQPPGEDYYVQQAIDLYRQNVVHKHARPKETEQHLTRLMEFFKGRTCESVTPELTEAYTRWRTRTGKPFLGEPPRTRDPVSEASARRDLEMLRAAFKYAFKCRKLKHEIPITLPPKSAPKERWLTHEEAARLIEAARDTPHLERFILIGLTTGTRASAILSMGWQPHPDGGHFDLERGLMFRAAPGERQTKKRKPPTPIPDDLLEHLKLWKQEAKGLYVIHAPNKPDARIDRISKSFNTAVKRAGLDRSVTPHTLRHSCVSWLMQAGRSAWDVGKFVGMSPQMVEDTYGHHSPEYLRDTANAVRSGVLAGL